MGVAQEINNLLYWQDDPLSASLDKFAQYRLVKFPGFKNQMIPPTTLLVPVSSSCDINITQEVEPGAAYLQYKQNHLGKTLGIKQQPKAASAAI